MCVSCQNECLIYNFNIEYLFKSLLYITGNMFLYIVKKKLNVPNKISNKLFINDSLFVCLFLVVMSIHV